MTKRDVNNLKHKLEVVVMESDRSVGQREAINIEPAADHLDRMTSAAEREIAVRNLEAAAKVRRDAREALRRIDQGSYGICEHCEGRIAPVRLAALPWAKLCVACQEAEDGASPRRSRVAFAMAA